MMILINKIEMVQRRAPLFCLNEDNGNGIYVWNDAQGNNINNRTGANIQWNFLN